MNGTGTGWHAGRLQCYWKEVNGPPRILVATICNSKNALTPEPAETYCENRAKKGRKFGLKLKARMKGKGFRGTIVSGRIS
jgi:hypothetical protein